MPTKNPINDQATEASALANELHKQLYGQEAETTKEASDTQNEPGKPDTQKEPQENDSAFEQRYLSLKGKFDAEVPRLTASVKYLEEERNQLTSRVAELQQQLIAAQAVKYADDVQSEPNYLDGFDDELGKGVKQAIDNAIKPLEEKFARVDDDVPVTPNNNQDDINKVAMLVGGIETFNQIDMNADFSSWLDTPMSRLDERSKRDVMLGHLGLGELRDVANFYVTWADSQQPEPSAPADDLNEQVHPDVTYANEISASGKTYSRKDIAAFYHDKTMGKYKGKEAEARSIELDIIAAQSEGRMIG